MTITDDETGFSITLGYDEDNFPVVYIHTGGGFYAENLRPTVLVTLNDVTIHEMFDTDGGEDARWEREASTENNQ